MKYVATICLSCALMFLYLKLTPEQKQAIVGKLGLSEIVSVDPMTAPVGTGQPGDIESSMGTSRSPELQVTADWFKGDAKKRSRLAQLEKTQRPPALQVKKWRNTLPLTPQARRDKIVVLTFWSTWCRPCLESIEVNNDICERFKNDEVLLIGICNTSGGEKMNDIIKEYDIRYPVAVDEFQRTANSYEVVAYPSYFIIDSKGKLRFADVKRYRVEDAIEFLLNE